MFLAIHTLLQDCEHVLTVLVAVATLPRDTVSLCLEVVPRRMFLSASARQLAECLLRRDCFTGSERIDRERANSCTLPRR